MLHISPSSIDRQVLQLEEHAGVSLFTRTSDGLKPTAAGALLADILDQSRLALDDVLLQVAGPGGGRSSKITVALSEGAGDFVGETLRTFCQDYRATEVVLHIANAAGVQAAILAGEADIGLAFNPAEISAIQIEAELGCLVGVVVPTNHALGARTSVCLRDCARYPLLLPDHSFGLRQKLDRAWQNSVGTRLGGAITTDSGAMLKRMILNGTGIGLLTDMEVRSEIRDGSLRFIPLQEKKMLQSTLAIIRLADRIPSFEVSCLLSRLVENIS